jgi:hypothetical protein
MKLHKKGKLYGNFGTKEDPSIMVVNQYTFETTDFEGTNIYTFSCKYFGKNSFFCFTYSEQDVKEIFTAFTMQLLKFTMAA